MRTNILFAAIDHVPDPLRAFAMRRTAELGGLALVLGTSLLAIALATWSVQDPSLNHATQGAVRNLLGAPGAIVADLIMQMFGLSAVAFLAPLTFWGWRLLTARRLERLKLRFILWVLGGLAAAGFASLLPVTTRWPLPTGLGGVVGDAMLALPHKLFTGAGLVAVAVFFAGFAVLALSASVKLSAHDAFEYDGDEDEELMPRPRGRALPDDEDAGGEPGLGLISLGALIHAGLSLKAGLKRLFRSRSNAAQPRGPAPWQAAAREDGFSGYVDEVPWPDERVEPRFDSLPFDASVYAPPATRAAPPEPEPEDEEEDAGPRRVRPGAPPLKSGQRIAKEVQPSLLDRLAPSNYQLPPLMILSEAKKQPASAGKLSEEALEQNARLLEGVLDDFGVKGEIINVRPGPVVTLYELEPAPGIKSSRVIGLADDIARSMSAVSARVAVVQGRNAIGIELPNQRRETVFLRELLASEDFEKSKFSLSIALGKTIGGEPIIVDLAKMPHLLVAGTTGSGKSVAINTMILSLLYRLKPSECRLIMVDPKMLELSVYDGIPHLLTPVVTDPKKAVVALKWAVREMEERYKSMSKLGVRNIDGFNARVIQAHNKRETITRTVQTGFDRETGEAIYEQEVMELSPLPYIVVIVDEMADLMMVAGKDIEGAIQRLAQMARAAGIHLIMATQRPSVDVITGTIKANFPTRISFQVTSKIDSRTILGEQGAEQLLGQGDMLYMAGGGRISRVHGPFVSDNEVEKVVAHLKSQGQPEYLDAITAELDLSAVEDGERPAPGSMDAEESGDLYDRAVAIVLRDRKCSTSYIQRRLSVGYNKAASLVERMEEEGVVGAPNHSGKRAILVGGGIDRGAFDLAGEG
ncbi:DNA translocase FtsK [Methyloferula stellata]|uniref:DNA translocase FtsK n=1 Tax=Methyloferula stellata TaxID=876270 RepID=UPI000362579F|nr:DNA translocase FtsK [Methyloferula stellata]